jgi:hypothetical protein
LDGVKNNADCTGGLGTSSAAYGGSCACASGTAFNPVCYQLHLLMFSWFLRAISHSMFPGVPNNIFFIIVFRYQKERLFKINSVQTRLNASNAP